MVGYKSPPEHSQFKPGQSGNPRGRKPKLRSVDGIAVSLLDKKIRAKVAGKMIWITRREALATRIVEGALSGDQRMIDIVSKIDRAQKRPEPHILSAEDEAELERALSAMARTKRADE